MSAARVTALRNLHSHSTELAAAPRSQSPALRLTVENACCSQLGLRGEGNFREAREARVEHFNVRPGDDAETRAPAAKGQPGPPRASAVGLTSAVSVPSVRLTLAFGSKRYRRRDRGLPAR
jgi:hypothetical protein